MSEKTKAPPPADSAKAEKGGLKKARPEVQALGRITNILDRLTDEERELTLSLVGRTYDIMRPSPVVLGAIDVSQIMENIRQHAAEPDREPMPEDAKLAMLRNENERLRAQLRTRSQYPQNQDVAATPGEKMSDSFIPARHPNEFISNPKPDPARVG